VEAGATVAWVRQERNGRLLAARELHDRQARTLLKVGSAALAACTPPNAAATTVAPAACTAPRRLSSGGAAVGDIGSSSAANEHSAASIVIFGRDRVSSRNGNKKQASVDQGNVDQYKPTITQKSELKKLFLIWKKLEEKCRRKKPIPSRRSDASSRTHSTALRCRRRTRQCARPTCSISQW
jgi:hypothetical protein